MSESRRAFLHNVSRGMLAAAVGPSLVADLGYGAAPTVDESRRLNFGNLEPLVSFLQETSGDKLLPLLVEKLRHGTELKELVAAAALANARTFGGEDYIGFHTLMALTPALAMSRELSEERRALPVLKVLVRNADRMHDVGGSGHEVLHRVDPTAMAGGEALRDAVRRKDLSSAEAGFASLANGKPEDALNHVLFVTEDDTEVHRVVLAYRAWDLLDVLGPAHAHTLLRQSLHYCADAEKWNPPSRAELRVLLPKLLDQHKLLEKPAGRRLAEDKWVGDLADTFFRSSPAQAAEAAASALAEGIVPDAIGEAICLTANQLLLRDRGRAAKNASPAKPVGSVHGDSIGVHASDSANAWRNLSRVANQRHSMAALILGAYQVALDRTRGSATFADWQPWPLPEHSKEVRSTDAAGLLKEAEAAIRNKDQGLASAALERYGRLGFPAQAAFEMLLPFAISEDGALHAEKYYRTASEEFTRSRPMDRWRQVTALARVTASAYGQPAVRHAEACRLLGV